VKKILIPQPIHKDVMKILENHFDIILTLQTDNKSLIEKIKDCDGLIIRTLKVSSEIINNAKKLKIIAQHGIGVNNIDVKTATKRGILVVNAPKANTDSVVEHVITMILALSKNLINMDGIVRKGNWNLRYQQINEELQGKVLGIIGLGNIGLRLAEKVKSLDIKVIGYDPFVKKEDLKEANIQFVNSKDQIFKKADFISLHIPLIESTQGFIGMREFKMMKKDAFFINAARGQVIDEKALYQVLLENRIKGAALDVFSEEPPNEGNPLFGLDNVIFSPHSAGLTEQSFKRMSTQVAQGIIDYFDNKKPEFIVNPEIIS